MMPTTRFPGYDSERWARSTRIGLVVALGFALLGFFISWKLGYPFHRKLPGLVYNLPIILIFPVFLIELLLASFPLSVDKIRREGIWILLWSLGFTILYYRLVKSAVPISGHMVWLPLLAARAWSRKAPFLLKIALLIVFLQALTFKFIFAGHWVDAGVGLIVGAGLSALGLVVDKCAIVGVKEE